MREKENKEAYAALILSVGIVGFVGLTVLLNSIGFFFHGVVSVAWPLLALFAAVYFIYFMLRDVSLLRWLAPLLFGVLVLGSVTFGLVTMDNSYDGNAYHKEAIGLLKEGWNPVYESTNSIYVDAYPKASWIVAASIYSLTGNIESGKALNALVVLAVFLAVYGYLRYRLDRNKSLLLAMIAAFSPVAVAQIYSFYVDGLMGGLLILLTVFLSIVVEKKKLLPSWCLYGVIALVIILLINVKFTGVAYAGLTVFVYWLYGIVRKEWSMVKRLTIAGAIGLVVGLFVVGIPTYVKNYTTHSHPLYPIMGPVSIDIMTANQPSSYAHKSGIHKFLESNFGETMNIMEATDDLVADSPLKIPFSIKIEELTYFAGGSPDIRQAGYGVWFGGVLLLTGLAIIVLAMNYKQFRHKQYMLFILPILPVIGGILLFDESWWARYTPHLIIVPVVVITALFLLAKQRKILPYVMIFALLVNGMLIAVLGANYQYRYRQVSTQKIHTLSEGCDNQTPLKFMITGDLSGAQFNLKDRCHNSVFQTVKPKLMSDLPDETSGWLGIYRQSQD